MEDVPSLLQSLLAALNASPDDLPLRMHVGHQLLAHGRFAEAAEQARDVLACAPGHEQANALLAQAIDALRAPVVEEAVAGYDWTAAEEAVAGPVPPAFVGESPDFTIGLDPDLAVSNVRLEDVGGMGEVKRRLDLAFLTPLRNPELQRLYGRSLSGGLVLYGPPGVGKTFIARAIAGELGAKFYAVSLADILDMWLGSSERNLREVFQTARRNAPCLLFLDELDAVGQKRSQLSGNPAMRGTVNQLLQEMDSVKADNTGVFVLGATNHPWDIDSALLRPGRFNRMLLVTPPDDRARRSILEYHLRDRPLSGIDLSKLVKATEHFSGADLAHLCDSAAELALDASVRSGQARPIGMKDFDEALKQVKPSTRVWLEEARNIALFSNQGGQYDELVEYLKRRKLA